MGVARTLAEPTQWVAYLGKNAVGATRAATTTKRVIMKKISVPGAGVILAVEFYGKSNTTGATPNMHVGVWEDNAGSPSRIVRDTQLPQAYLEQAANLKEDRWIGAAANVFTPNAADYWIGFEVNSATFDLARDASVGSDRYYLMGYDPGLADSGIYAVTTTTDDYSIRASFLRVRSG